MLSLESVHTIRSTSLWMCIKGHVTCVLSKCFFPLFISFVHTGHFTQQHWHWHITESPVPHYRRAGGWIQFINITKSVCLRTENKQRITVSCFWNDWRHKLDRNQLIKGKCTVEWLEWNRKEKEKIHWMGEEFVQTKSQWRWTNENEDPAASCQVAPESCSNSQTQQLENKS